MSELDERPDPLEISRSFGDTSKRSFGDTFGAIQSVTESVTESRPKDVPRRLEDLRQRGLRRRTPCVVAAALRRNVSRESARPDPGLLMNFDFARLSIASKGTLLLIWLLQADRGGPVKLTDLADHMFPAGYHQLEALVDAGFVELTDTETPAA